MSSDVVAPGAQPRPVDLGKSPIVIALMRLGGFGLAGAVLAAVAFANHGGVAGVLVLMLGLPWGILMAYLGIRLVVLVASGGGAAFRRTEAAVAAGQLGASYFAKGNDHIVVVDEPGRRICVNGDVVGFDRIRDVTWQSGNNRHRLTFVLDGGENPVRYVDLYNDHEMKVAFERIRNSLGLR